MPDEIGKKIEFILQMQAQFEANLSRSEANIENLSGTVAELVGVAIGSETKIENLRVSVADLARVVRDSIKLSDERFTRFDERLAKLTEAQKTTDERLAKLVEAQKTTDERLNALISVTERHITGPDHLARP